MHLDPAFEKAVTFPRLPRQQLEGSKDLHGDDDDQGLYINMAVSFPSE